MHRHTHKQKQKTSKKKTLSQITIIFMYQKNQLAESLEEVTWLHHCKLYPHNAPAGTWWLSMHMPTDLKLVRISCLRSSLVGRQFKNSATYRAMRLLSRDRPTLRLFVLSRQRAHSAPPCPGSLQHYSGCANPHWMNSQVAEQSPLIMIYGKEREGIA